MFPIFFKDSFFYEIIYNLFYFFFQPKGTTTVAINFYLFVYLIIYLPIYFKIYKHDTDISTTAVLHNGPVS